MKKSFREFLSFLFILFLIVMGFVLIQHALAADTSNPLPVGQVTLPGKFSSVRDLLVKVIDWILGFGGALAVIAIVYSGVMYIISGGDPAKAEAAKKNLVWAIIGIVVIALSVIIVATVNNVLSGTP